MYTEADQVEVQRCLWDECHLDFTDAEALYDHITTVHIGRKSAGTLSLECHWQGCNSKATKRDHLTSHARVHINLKPHKCSVCSKSFKRPQDLKKHEKIHTEEHHAHHRHSKAVTVAPSESLASSTNSLKRESSASADTNSTATPIAAHPPTSLQQAGPYGHAYSYPGFGYPHPMMYNLPAGPSMHPHQPQLDLAQLVAFQQHLNAQQQAAFQTPGSNMSAYGAMAGYPSQAYPVGAGQNAYAQQMAYNPYGMAYPFYHHQIPGQPQQQQQPMQSMYPTLPHAPTAPGGGPLYPSINSLANAVPRQSADDQPSPARSSQSSSLHSPVPSNAASSSSVSPRTHATTLSPPGLSYSPSPEQESEASFRSRGTKRDRGGFEDAAGQFLGDLRKKRFSAVDDVGSQLDALSSFLLSPENNEAPLLEPSRSQAGSESSGQSDYSKQEVDSINELLISLGQNIATDAAQVEQQHQQPVAPNYGTAFAPVEAYNPTAQAHSLYPSLTKHSVGAAPHQSTPIGSMYPSMTGAAGAPFDYGSVRLSKAAPAPTLTNELKMPMYQSVARLGRAAPSAYSYRDSKDMDIDDDDHHDSRKAYASSLRSTSMDLSDSPSSSKSPALSDGPRLPPITASAGASPSSGTTLPPISELLRHSSSSSSSLSSPSMSHSSSSQSVSSSRTLYPSIDQSERSHSSLSPSNDFRPQSSGGTVDRLTSSVHHLGMRHDDEDDVVEEDEDELLEPKSEDSDADMESKHKRSRVDSPQPMAQLDEAELRERKAQAAVVERRMFALRALIVYVNSTYRHKLVAKEWKAVEA